MASRFFRTPNSVRKSMIPMKYSSEPSSLHKPWTLECKVKLHTIRISRLPMEDIQHPIVRPAQKFALMNGNIREHLKVTESHRHRQWLLLARKESSMLIWERQRPQHQLQPACRSRLKK